jgi:hypothetical protein
MKFDDELHRALRYLEENHPFGCTEAIMIAHGFRGQTLVALIKAGLAGNSTESMVAGNRNVTVTRVRITGAGRWLHGGGGRVLAEISSDMSHALRLGISPSGGAVAKLTHISPVFSG